MSTEKQVTTKSQDTVTNIQILELDLLTKNIEQRISTLQLIARSLANDAHIHSWVNSDMPESGEQVLLDKLNFFVDEYDLTSASFADKTTN